MRHSIQFILELKKRSRFLLQPATATLVRMEEHVAMWRPVLTIVVTAETDSEEEIVSCVSFFHRTQESFLL